MVQSAGKVSDKSKAVISDLANPRYYLNREISQLQFNARVLEQAVKLEYPLLERLRYVMIVNRNLDEFFEIRVAGLRQQIAYEREQVNSDGLSPQEVLTRINQITHELVRRQYQILNEQLLPQMSAHNIHFLRRDNLNEAQLAWVKQYFYEQITPVISPVGLDPAHPFPRLANKILNFLVELEGKDAFGRETGLAIVPAPRSLPRLIRIPDAVCDQAGSHYLFLSSIIHLHTEDLFPGMQVKGFYQFRLTRNSDLSVDPDVVEDLAIALKGELHARRYGSAVRLELADNCPQHLQNFLLEQFGLTDNELYQVAGPVSLLRFESMIANHQQGDLVFKPFTPSYPKALKNPATLFDHIRRKDELLLHPFETFTPVVDLLRQAAQDPKVLAIKQTLYRTGNRSDMVDALVDAAKNGKEVTAVVEIRARFDEEENLSLARRLQDAGALVVYGVVGYKTHAKMLLIVRREQQKIVRYVHLGTGNYHAGNARQYTDYSFLSADKALTNDVHKVFQQLTGMGKTVRVKKLLHAPFTLKRKLLDLIHQEALSAKATGKGRIIVKVNALTESKTIKALYKASQAGVTIDLIVRGACCLRPEVPGLSERIRVRSVLGRFLEHSRVYYFENQGEPLVFCASADWMVRNLDARVEACFPIEDNKLKTRIKKELEMYLADNSSSWQLQPDGTYRANEPVRGQKPRNVQHQLLEKLADAT